MPRPLPATFVNHWTSAVGALAGVLLARGSSLTAAEVDVLSGHAFRLAVTRTPDGDVGPDGPSCFSSQSAFPLYEGLGLHLRAIEAAPDAPDFAARREQALQELRRSTERGLPAIAFGLHLPDFGIVRGVDEAAGALIVSTTMSPQYGERLPFAQWPLPGRPQPLRVFFVEQNLRFDRRRALDAALAFAYRYAGDGDPSPAPGCEPLAYGLAAFARWAELLEGEGAISPEGQAYCIQALQQARHDAAAVLRVEAKRLRVPALAEAAEAYAAVVLELSRMATLFPYPSGGDVRSPGTRRAGAAALRRARAAEERALAALDR